MIYLLVSHETHAAIDPAFGHEADLHTTAHARVSSAYDAGY